MKNKLDSRDICLLEKQAAFTAIYKNMSAGRSDCCRFIAACGSEQEITMRVKMIVAYDGTNYKGWQVQPNGITIEEVLNKNLSNLLGEQIVVSGASRTDSGVHSLGNIAVFDTNTRMPADKIAFALNQRLPEDIVVQGSCEVEDKTAGYLFLSLSTGCGENEKSGILSWGRA